MTKEELAKLKPGDLVFRPGESGTYCVNDLYLFDGRIRVSLESVGGLTAIDMMRFELYPLCSQPTS
jgi:hypothetical protein